MTKINSEMIKKLWFKFEHLTQTSEQKKKIPYQTICLTPMMEGFTLSFFNTKHQAENLRIPVFTLLGLTHKAVKPNSFI